ncbi:hypothetical protein P872_19460 [Rhodonellum psychrophilum GCM71 = DSM 17998]|uniref:Uncharacterized protein n=1 Tax=Rhodonellum psychrophilum GCM71 = DSM 17998 TaxID=1123057 RepID=U5BYE9_9BACT|nr:hypothetical protein P872_19460 [Rhodonellum psychrophilum GCM71 = DSM 17998]
MIWSDSLILLGFLLTKRIWSVYIFSSLASWVPILPVEPKMV